MNVPLFANYGIICFQYLRKISYFDDNTWRVAQTHAPVQIVSTTSNELVKVFLFCGANLNLCLLANN
jgi:hypothetical protein